MPGHQVGFLDPGRVKGGDHQRQVDHLFQFVAAKPGPTGGEYLFGFGRLHSP